MSIYLAGDRIKTLIEDCDSDHAGAERLIHIGTCGTVLGLDYGLYDVVWDNGAWTRWTGEELERDTVMSTTDRPVRYVNAYDTNRSYGGPEEGGWWFDTGEPLASIPVRTDAEVEEAKARLHAIYAPEFAGNHEISSLLCEGQLGVYVESHIARPFPTYRPHYE